MRDGLGRWGRVLVVGGTSEIAGAVLAAVDLQPGAQVLLAGRDLSALAGAPLPAHARREVLAYDAREADAAAALAAAVAAHGDLDLVVLAAGVLGTGAEHDPAAARDVLLANLVGPVALLVALTEAMRRQGHGCVVVLSSMAALRPRRANYLYGASKAGLDAFANGLADRVRTDGVRVLVVRPGFVRGRMTSGMTVPPLSTTPAQVGRAVARALRAGADVVAVPGAMRVVGPLLSLVPRRLWRRLDL